MRHRLNRGSLLVGFAVTLVIALGFVWLFGQRRIRLYRDDARTRAAVLERVPVGTAIDSARQIIEAAGFVCALEDDVDLTPDPWRNRLYCARSGCGGIGRREWRISFYFAESRRVEGVRVVSGISAF